MALSETLDEGTQVRILHAADLKRALAMGWSDFRAAPTHLYFLILFYPVAMFVGVWAAIDENMIPLLFPILSGAALLGPFTAIVLYEVSRQREAGKRVAWWQAFGLIAARSALSVVALALALIVLFVVWIWAGLELYRGLMGSVVDPSLTGFLGEVFSTSAGWTMIVIGNGVGLLFALVALAAFAFSFQVLVDRGGDPMTAVLLSLKVFFANPLAMLTWGLIVVALLAATIVTLFAGLAVVLPLLGHASWHLYRAAVRSA